MFAYAWPTRVRTPALSFGVLLALASACGDDLELPVAVSGTVTDASSLMPALGVQVDAEEAGATVTTDSAGRYQLELEPQRVVWLRTSGAGAIPVRRPLLVPTAPAATFALDFLPEAFPAQVYPALGLEAQAADRGVVALHFLGRSLEGGETGSLDVAFGGSFTFALDGPQLADSLAPGVYDGLIFSNVVPGTFRVTNVSSECTLVNLPEAAGIVRPGELTRIDFSCQ